MKAFVDADLCTVCAVCVDICPEVFQLGEKIAEVQINPIPAEYEKSCREAGEACMVDAIVIEE